MQIVDLRSFLRIDEIASLPIEFKHVSNNQANKAPLPSTIFIFLMFWKITLIDYVPEQAVVVSVLWS